MNNEDILKKTAAIICESIRCGPVPITRDTRATDVRGWDSLSHTMILMQLEDGFAIRLPMERVLTATTVGDLVDLIAELKPAGGTSSP